jgi:hypothetical protein
MNETSDNNPQYPISRQETELRDRNGRGKWSVRILFYAHAIMGEEERDAHREASASSIPHWNDPALTAWETASVQVELGNK